MVSVELTIIKCVKTKFKHGRESLIQIQIRIVLFVTSITYSSIACSKEVMYLHDRVHHL